VLYLWVVLRIAGVQSNGLQIKSAVQIDRGDDVLESGGQAARAGSGSGSGGRSGGSHPDSVGRRVPVGNGRRLAIGLGVHGLITQILVTIREGERAGGREGLGLGRGRRVGLDGLHDGDTSQDVLILWDRRLATRSNGGEVQVNVSPTTAVQIDTLVG
jgi:hypothetical protein